jgi:hypothetical protein
LLPQSICAFDIETAKATTGSPEDCEVACAGMLVYKRAGSSWRRAGYQWFGAGELVELAEFMRGFPGLILGHNVFDFDYRVLRPHIVLKGIVEKTVDLRLLLHNLDRSRDARLSLESLARLNLGRGKIDDSRNIPALWRAGKRRCVLAHNRRDCELTLELWLDLLRRRRVYTDCIHARDGQACELTPDALAILAGRIPQLTYREWLSRLDKWGNAVRPPDYHAKTYVEEPDAGRRPIFHRNYCPNCQRYYVLVARRKRWIRKQETLPCPFCQGPVYLRSHGTLTWRRKRDGTCTWFGLGLSRQPSQIPAARFPDAKTARAWIDGRRIWSY